MTTKTWNATNLSGWWKDRQRTDAVEWTRLSAEVGEWLRERTGRDDLIAVVEPDSGKGHPAVYLSESASVEINPEVCAPGVAPSDMSMSTEVGRLRHAPFSGAARHEGGHAAHSQWKIDQSKEKYAIVKSALLLEEARMEGRVVAEHPEDRILLRATFAQIVNKGGHAPGSIAEAAHLVALAGARVDAGVLDVAEVADLIQSVWDVLGEDTFDCLRVVWREALRQDDDAQAEMEALGDLWNRIVRSAQKDAGEEPDGGEEGGMVIFVCGMGGGEGEGGEEGEGEGSAAGEAMEAIKEAIAAAAEAEAEAEVDAAKVRDAAASRAEDAKEGRESERQAAIVFGRHSGSATYNGEGVVGQRNPTVKERAQANMLARAIQKAQFRERSKTVVASAVPPGRLKTSAAVRRSAERAMGIPTTVEPWRQVQRKHVENPPVTLGLMMDVSGSMGAAEGPVASAAWVVGHAVHRNEGTVAMVAFGNGVHSVLKPGDNPRTAPVLDARGGTERFCEGLQALDGALNLSNGAGPRVVAVVSDGHYTIAQRQKGEKMVKRLQARGVHVMWVGVGPSHYNHPMLGTEYVAIGSDVDGLAKALGAAMTRLLTKA